MLYFIWIILMALIGFVCIITGVPFKPFGWIWLTITYVGIIVIVLFLWLKKSK
jgi:hypothetical protein